MSNNQGGGLFGGLLMGAGITILLAVPFAAVWLIFKKIGLLGLALFTAVFATMMAVFVPPFISSLDIDPGYDQMGQALFQFVEALKLFPFWWGAAVCWLGVVLLFVAAKGLENSSPEEIAK